MLMVADGIGASAADAGHHAGVQAATTASTARSMKKAEITPPPPQYRVLRVRFCAGINQLLLPRGSVVHSWPAIKNAEILT